ncbi:SDR family NAD(P)-dependent oxidoreductase [Aliiglaciecola litoralis]|uniref:SDR family NAD(P)-dependent oxidoreductase n=1 Tax=Aliiglaciecola litoralis TaxID=582857 RepID=A0ABP3WWK1_9ALTE
MSSILITGATSGIGKALTKLCAAKGYSVIACGRNQHVLDELAQDPNIQTLTFDVTELAQVKTALQDVKVDIAVLNAGVCEYVDVEDFEADMFQRVFSANFFGVVNCVNGLLPNMTKGNQLVVVDSLARLLPFTRSQAYGASKAAVHYFTKSMQVDLAGTGIIVQSASPGFVETPLTDKNDFEMPMKIPVEQAVEALLDGIEKQHASIYFPKGFSLMLRILSILPSWLKVAISKKFKNKQ